MEDLKIKLDRLENIIDCVLKQNLLENSDAKTYINYLNKVLQELQRVKEKTKFMEYEVLANNCIESIIVLQTLIEIIKGIE